MPSDARAAALAALAPRIGALRTMLVAAAEEIRAWLAAQDADGRPAAERWAAELGPFAAGRITSDRVAELFTATTAVEDAHLEVARRGLEILDRLAERHADLVSLRVPPGGDLVAEVERALARIGRAFAAARLAEHARSGRGPGLDDLRDVDALPFRRWRRVERAAAPPLVIEVDGADLVVAGLAPYLDGRQRLVLLIAGDMAPAPLVRLITPGTFVSQTADVADLSRLLAWDGPGIAALVGETAARFIHDPAAGAASWQRLTVDHVPDAPKRPVGGTSVAQQTEELRQLAALAERPTAAAAASLSAAPGAVPVAGAPDSASPADKLAAWLLRQADLTDLG